MNHDDLLKVFGDSLKQELETITKNLDEQTKTYKLKKIQEMEEIVAQSQQSATEHYTRQMAKVEKMQAEKYPAVLIEQFKLSVQKQYEIATDFNKKAFTNFIQSI